MHPPPAHAVARRGPLPARAAACLSALLAAVLTVAAATRVGTVAAAAPDANATPAATTAPSAAPVSAPATSAAADEGCPPVTPAPGADEIARARREARDHGVLWRITKQGHSSYLYGTLHVGKLGWSFAGPRLSQALKATDTLALELDVSDPALFSTPPPAAVAPLALPAPLRERLARQVALACVPGQALQHLNPLMQAVTLTVLSARREGLDARFAQEIVLAEAARAQGRPIVALEDVQSQMAVLLPSDPAEARRLLEQSLQQLEHGRARVLLRRLAEAWGASRLDELESYAAWCECADSAEDRRFLQRLNDDRNAPMAERVDRLHAQGRRVLVAVGALHMTGAQGLPRLMAARGYRVERLVPP